MTETIEIDGHGPLPVHIPDSPAGVCDLVKQQRARSEAVYPVGGRTMLDFGVPPKKPGIALDMTKLSRVIDYPSRDMTITVQAGITFAKLQATLAQENQWLPLDVPDPERMTLGGLIACNVSGPRRNGYGTLRDYLIGISFVSDEGVEVKGGGRVVKNVAGYDLMKLHIGALGTLGVITQVTLKVVPRPERKVGLTFNCDPGRLPAFLTTLQQSKCRPVGASFLRLSNEPFIGKLFLEGSALDVESQLTQLALDFDSKIFDMLTHHHGNECDTVANAETRRRLDSQQHYISRFVMKPSEVAGFSSKTSARLQFGEFLNGVVWLANDEPIETSVPGVTFRAPSSWKTAERVFGKPTPALELMRHIKKTLDPSDILNSGRMLS